MLETKRLYGRLNLDDDLHSVGPQDHVGARNIRFVSGQVVAEKGNTLVANTLPAGTNITIGSRYDEVRQRVFFCNYNSNGVHGIFVYDIRTNSIATLVQIGAGTDGDILRFTADSYFPDMRIIYGDSTQGDILTWLNSQKLPSKINIDRALGTLGTYGVVQASYLTVDKEMCQFPPAVVFEDDATITVNNFRKKLMKYKVRYVFDDKDKCCYSSQSVLPLPIGYTDTNADYNADPSINARVAIVIPTWKDNVKKIEICACESLGNVFGDWFLIEVLDKDELSIPNDSLYVYRFYNDQAYTYIDVNESEQEFDWVPQEANAQELLNGNVICYGGILEGYDQITSDASSTVGNAGLVNDTQLPFVFVASQSANSGFGEGEIQVVITGAILNGFTFHIYTTSEDISYSSTETDDATDVLNGLLADAISEGFTGSVVGDSLYIEKANESLLRVLAIRNSTKDVTETAISIDFTNLPSPFFTLPYSIDWAGTPTTLVISNASNPTFDGTYTITNISTDGANPTTVDVEVSVPPVIADTTFTADIEINPLNILYATDSFAYDWSSRYAFGLEYFDYWGRTMGVITQQALSAQTDAYSGAALVNDAIPYAYLPQISLSISHRPPIEAYYYHWVRTKNLTKSDFIQWISNATYKDADYAYISIEILNQYIIVNPQSNFLAWDFTPGDRIRFMRSMNAEEIYTNGDKDYEIIANLSSPYINGLLVEGQVLKIALPTTDGDFDFGGTDWANYFIEVYTPAKNVGNGLDVYYEFGERYMIGNPGTATRFHQGQLQNQSTNLATPATFSFNQGDNYFAQRKLNLGNVIKYAYQAYTVEETGTAWFAGMDLISSYDVQDYIVQGEMYLEFSPGTVQTYFIRVLDNEYTFSFSGEVKIRINTLAGTTDSISVVVAAVDLAGLAISSIVLGTVAGPLVDNQLVIIPLSGTITRDATDGGYLNSTIEFDFPGGPTDVNYTVVSGYLTVNQTGSEFTLGMQNPNYSFFYESQVNSNGRPWVVNPDGRQNYNMVLFRYGQAYQQDTNINNINRFFASQVDEYARSKGDIRRLVFRQRILRVFQAAGVGEVGVYNQFITNAAGETQLIYTTQIITANNIQYYAGEYGMGAQSWGLISSKTMDYFVDPVTGEQIRLSANGQVSISKLYKGQFYIGNLFLPYNFTYTRPDGSIAKILGVYDYFNEQAVCVLQSGVTYPLNEIRLGKILCAYPMIVISLNRWPMAYG